MVIGISAFTAFAVKRLRTVALNAESLLRIGRILMVRLASLPIIMSLCAFYVMHVMTIWNAHGQARITRYAMRPIGAAPKQDTSLTSAVVMSAENGKERHIYGNGTASYRLMTSTLRKFPSSFHRVYALRLPLFGPLEDWNLL